MMNTQDCGHGTNVGKVRKHNEDSYLVDPSNGIFIISDGMGGHSAGEVASAIVIDSIAADLQKDIPLSQAITNSHQALFDATRAGQGKPGMGATVVALCMQGDAYQVAWVGDSRAYLWDNGLVQLTHDHSYVQKMIDAGILSDDEARDHPDHSVLSQALGSLQVEKIVVEEVSGRLCLGQKILLCSDGLTSELSEARIDEIIRKGQNNPETVTSLIHAAIGHGGEDNITVILVSAPDDACPVPARGGTRQMDTGRLNREYEQRKRRRLFRMMLVILMILLCLAGLLYFFWPRHQSLEADEKSMTEGIFRPKARSNPP